MTPARTDKDETLLTRVAARLKDLTGAGPTSPEEAQEALDFLAVAAGLKPVFVAGRGAGDSGWRDAVGNIAASEGLAVSRGPLWEATPWTPPEARNGIPEWYREGCARQLARRDALYICGSGPDADAVSTVNTAAGRLTIDDEARLLGYPECCVAAHYERAICYHRATMSMLRRLGANDETRMRALFEGGANMAPATQEELDDLDAAFDIRPAPFGSWNMCAKCADDPGSPSARLSARYRKLAGDAWPELEGILAG